MRLDPDPVALVRKLVAEALGNPDVAVKIDEHPEAATTRRGRVSPPATA